jgi:hypothetical protein
VSGYRLYSNVNGTNTAEISSALLSLNSVLNLNDSYLQENDVAANYTGSDLSSMVTFTPDVLGNSSYAYWVNYKTLRIIPSSGAVNLTAVYSTVYVNMSSAFARVPTKYGMVYGDTTASVQL